MAGLEFYLIGPLAHFNLPFGQILDAWLPLQKLEPAF